MIDVVGKWFLANLFFFLRKQGKRIQVLLRFHQRRDIGIQTQRTNILPFAVLKENRAVADDPAVVSHHDFIIAVSIGLFAGKNLQPPGSAAVANLSSADLTVADINDRMRVILRVVVQHDLALRSEMMFQQIQDLRKKQKLFFD